MTSWGELAFAVVGWFALVFSVFWLGRMWERDHAKPCTRWHVQNVSRARYSVDEGKTWHDLDGTPPPFRVRRAPYDWTNEG